MSIAFLSAPGKGTCAVLRLGYDAFRRTPMKTFLAPFVLMLLLAVCLTGCLQEDSLDSIRVDGEMSTVFRTGSGPSHMYGRTRTGISF